MKTPQGPTVRCHYAYLLLSILLLSGCQEGVSSQKISGKVTFQGKHVTVDDVIFNHLGTGRVAQGSLDSEGQYTLFQTKNALNPGEYRVTVSPKVAYEKVKVRGGMDMKTVETGGESIPMIYRNDATTRLNATITGTGEESFDFELKD